MWKAEIKPASVRRVKRATLGRILGLLFSGMVLTVPPSLSWAQQWPTKTVRIVVNGPAGGVVDTVVRLVGTHLSERLGSPVIVDNKSGASGLIGVQNVLQAPADGSTFLASMDGVLTEVPHSVKINFDPLKDVTPIVDLFYNGWVLVSSDKVPAKSLSDVVAWAKKKPEGVNYGSFSTGTISHILGLQLAKSAGLQMNHVPYRGGPDAMQALMGGQVPLLFSGIVQSLPHIKTGKITALVFTGTERSSFLPDVPTAKELGYPELTAVSWVGIWARKDVPVALQDRLNKEVARILAMPDVREKIAAMGTNAAKPRSSAELVKQMAIDYRHAGAVLQAAGVKSQ